MSAEDRLDIIILGASGYTGRLAVVEAVKILSKVSWGIAGRNQEKLETVLKETGEQTGVNLSKVPIIIADVDDQESLNQMASRAKLIVNCIGPYDLYGEAVVKACINAGAHQVDVSAELLFGERMQLEYNDLAKEKGVYVINSCGLGFLQFELGSAFLEKHFDGQVNSIETYLSFGVKGYKSGQVVMNYATWDSMVNSFATENEWAKVHAKLFPVKLPEMKPSVPTRFIHKSPDNKWSLPFIGPSATLMDRTRQFLWLEDKKKPIQYRVYFSFSSFYMIFKAMFLAMMCGILSKFSAGTRWLLNNPKLFSNGFFSHNGPSEETRNNSIAKLTLYGKGWSKEETLEEHTDPPNKTLTVEVSVRDPGYRASATSILLSGLTILNEHAKMPGHGGVMSPGAAFAKTNLIQAVKEHEWNFEIVSVKEQEKKDDKADNIHTLKED